MAESAAETAGPSGAGLPPMPTRPAPGAPDSMSMPASPPAQAEPPAAQSATAEPATGASTWARGSTG
eukprot:14244274-Alexandrium_andersonii.AAC.1